MARRREFERKILSLLHNKKTRIKLPEIHAQIIRHDLDQLNSVLSHFVAVCGSLGKMCYAEKIFLGAGYPDIYLFNAMIKGFSLVGPFSRSITVYSVMKKRGVCGDCYTYAPLLKACSSFRDLRLGRCAHKDAFVNGFEWFPSVRVGILELYASNGELHDARKVFEEMPHKEAILWNLMIQGYCRTGQINTGLELFWDMKNRSVVSWNIMITGLAECGREDEALGYFDTMQTEGCQPDEATLVTLLPICGRIGAMDIGKKLHSYAESSGLLRKFASVGNSLMYFYGKCDSLETALKVFAEMPKKTVISWNTLISFLAYRGRDKHGIELFEQMIEEGFEPNEATFVGVLTCCSHGGLVERGREFFNLMSTRYQIEPTIEHHGCMIDLLGREGYLREAYDLARRMRERANSAIWGSLLCACRTQGDLAMAKACVEELAKLEPWNSGNYVQLSNLYADEKKWDEVEKVRLLMKEKGIAKAPGLSAIHWNSI